MKFSHVRVACALNSVCTFTKAETSKKCKFWLPSLVQLAKNKTKTKNEYKTTREKQNSSDQLKGEKKGKTMACVNPTDFFPLFEIFVSKSYDRSPAPHIHPRIIAYSEHIQAENLW